MRRMIADGGRHRATLTERDSGGVAMESGRVGFGSRAWRLRAGGPEGTAAGLEVNLAGGWGKACGRHWGFFPVTRGGDISDLWRTHIVTLRGEWLVGRQAAGSQ